MSEAFAHFQVKTETLSFEIVIDYIVLISPCTMIQFDGSNDTDQLEN